MQTSEEFILEHATAPYDPAKARAYYLRTRQLKGRKAGVKPLSGLTAKGPKATGGVKPKVLKSKTTVTSKRQQEVQVRVTALRGKLKVLNGILKELVKKVEADNPAPKTATGKSGDAKTSAADTKKLTAAQKQDKAKKAKDKYDKDPVVEAKRQLKIKRQKKIAEVKVQIKQVQVELKTSIARAREVSLQKKPAAQSRRNP